MDERLFKKVNVKVQPKSGFDLSYQNLLTTKVGTITPLVCEELIPNETVNLDLAIQAQLPPLASDTFMRCKLKYEAFFVPSRLMFQGFERWLMPNASASTSSNSSANFMPRMPLAKLGTNVVGRGSLADYLGVKVAFPENYTKEVSTAATITVNALPFIGYHLIYNEWYRNTLVQKPLYDEFISSSQGYNASRLKAAIPCGTYGYTIDSTYSGTSSNDRGSYLFADGSSFFDLHQRNFGIDYFTSSTPSAQNGAVQGLSMTVSNSTAGFTIAQLRAANAIQMWEERNNLCGNRLVDYVKANYGANLSDAVAQRPVLLGSGEFDVYSKGIYQSQNDTDTTNDTNNPFGSVGAKYGSAYAGGNSSLIHNFTAQEPGWLYVLVTLVPKVTYSSGIDRKFIRYITNDVSDMANPALQGIGMQPVYSTELSGSKAFWQGNATGTVFGYQERYADFKSKNDELHGLLRENNGYFSTGSTVDTGGTLSSFALQSSFDSGSSLDPQITSEFLEIPTTYLDNVAAVKGDISKYGCWIDSYIDFKAAMPLARYSMPTLMDPAYEHGYDVELNRGGSRF